ncbi:glutathione peroxidase [Neoconidiobolus thromboides FSU 785]|nr:glutathione peroxidase [Neoconidiobolus thromboides FSU 785]
MTEKKEEEIKQVPKEGGKGSLLWIVLSMIILLIAYFYYDQSKGNDDIQRPDLYKFRIPDIENNIIDFKQYKDKALLIVNVASDCGFTNQYQGLQTLFEKYEKDGLVVLAFPSDQFNQERETQEEILDFVKTTYKVTFPIMTKVAVNGDEAHPLFKYLTEKKSGIMGVKKIKWNFEVNN